MSEHDKQSPWRVDRRGVLRMGGAALTGLAGAPFIHRTAWGETGVEGKTLGFSMSFSNTEWIRQQYNGVVETAKAYGLETVIYDANDQPTKQVRDLEDLVVRYADVILISTYYAEAIRPAVEEDRKSTRLNSS